MEMMALGFTVLAFDWTGAGTASGAALISSIAALILSIVALANVLKHDKDKVIHNGKEEHNGKDDG